VAVGCAQVITMRRDGRGEPLFAGASDPRSPEGAAATR
jgi:hypothetical protein